MTIGRLSSVRFLALVLLLLIVPACKRRGELSETLAWMDNTYNPHGDVLGAPGHGRTGWYSRSSAGQAHEYLVWGSAETFTYDGCKMTLRVQDNPYASAHSEMYGAYVYSFDLRDINPQSIKLSTYSHLGGFPCDNYTPEELQSMNCDQADIGFSTRSEAPLIAEESHTTFPKLQGLSHESNSKSKAARAFFGVDDVEYAGRFAKALRHAVELCGGRPEPF